MNRNINHLTENKIIEFVSIYFEKKNYTVKKLDGFIVAFNQNNIKCCIIVKGNVSHIKGSKKYNKPFKENQIKQNIGVALLKSLQLKETEDITIIIAVPDDNNHREIFKSIENCLLKVNIKFIFVKIDGNIEEK